MAFYDSIIFPDELALDGSGGPTWRTQVVENPGGHEGRNIKWSYGRAEYEVGLVPRTLAQTQTLIAIANIVHGQGHGFRFLDRITGDYTGTDEPLGIGTGTPQNLQVIKRYAAGAQTHDRIITKIASVMNVKVAGTPTGAYTLNSNTGVLTITATLSAAVTMSYTFHVPVRLRMDATKIRAMEPGIMSWPSVQLIEVRDIT